MSNLTKFQEKKIEKVFSMLYDSNNDGFIEKQDFILLLEKVSGILGWKKESPKYQNAKETLDLVWGGLKGIADTDDDGKISTLEWSKMWGDCLENLEKGQFPEWQKKYMNFMFDVNDKSGDECIDEAEYTTFMSRFGISNDECKNAFDKISGEGQVITRDQFAALWKEYLTSDDKTLPGNYLFGPKFD